MNMTIEINKCARCGGDHKLTFEPLTNHDRYTHWSLCPIVSQPILMIVVDDDD